MDIKQQAKQTVLDTLYGIAVILCVAVPLVVAMAGGFYLLTKWPEVMVVICLLFLLVVFGYLQGKERRRYIDKQKKWEQTRQEWEWEQENGPER